MANLFFPQLLSGALVQYPVRKIGQFRTVMNVYADGSVSAYPDAPAARLEWNLQFSGISNTELASLQSLYSQCVGPLYPFTFIDPTDNMLVSSSDFSKAPWVTPAGCMVAGGVTDPLGGTGAFSFVNASQVSGGITQTLQVPGNYQYCFSAYVRSASGGPVSLQMNTPATSKIQSFMTTPIWSRAILSAKLNDTGTSVTVSLVADPGVMIQVYGPQFEAQPLASTYKATTSRGAVYPSCHWTNSEMLVTALGPAVFAIECGIETSL